MNKAVFLDRDGTINVEKNYLYRISDFEFLPGAVEALQNLQAGGFKLIIITNQSGIARGLYGIDDFLVLNDWMKETLKGYGVCIDDVYYCPHHPSSLIDVYRVDCDCRKPKTGLFERAIVDYNIDLKKSFAIGDKIRDCSICQNTECQGFLISQNEDAGIIKRVIDGEYKHIKYAFNLKEAADMILSL